MRLITLLIFLRRSSLFYVVSSLRSTFLGLGRVAASSTCMFTISASSARRNALIGLVSLRVLYMTSISFVVVIALTDGILLSRSRISGWSLLISSLIGIALRFLALGNPYKLLVFRFFLRGGRILLLSTTSYRFRGMLAAFTAAIMSLFLLRIHLKITIN